MVEVERQQGQWSAASFGPRDLGADALDELAPISGTGQRVGGGKTLQLLIALLHFLQRALSAGHCLGQASHQFFLAIDGRE